MIGFETWMARRMLLSRKKVGLISWSGIISILGVGMGCFALIVSVAVLNGFEQEVRNKVIGFETDLRIMAGDDQINMEKFAVLESNLRITSYSPFIERKVVAISPNDRSLVKVKAVKMETLQSVYKIEGIDIIDSPKNKTPVYIGKGIADRLGIQEGDRLRLMNPLDNQLYLGMPSVLDAQVAGVFETRILDFDQTYIFIPITIGQTLFKTVGQIDGIDFRLKENSEKEQLREAVLATLGEDVTIVEVEEMHQTLFQAMKMEKLGSIVVLSLIVIVACFNIASTLTMLVMEKIREVGILKAIGFSKARISTIFRMQGIFIGGIGLMLGTGLGLLFVSGQERLGFIRLPEAIYFVHSLPVAIRSEDIAAIILIGIIVITLAIHFPIREARKLLPTEAIQFEK